MDYNSLSEEIKEACQVISDTRRPQVFFRGKTLTHEQLVELFINEEPILRDWGPNGEDLCKTKRIRDTRGYYGMLGCCLHRRGFPWLTSMVMSDGTIYGSELEVKYPEWDVYIPDWEDFALRNPFIDMIVAYTDNDENPCYFCDLVNHLGDKHRDLNRKCRWGGTCLAKLNRTFADNCYVSSEKEWKKIPGDGDYKSEFYRHAGHHLMPFDAHKRVQLVIHMHDGKIDLLAGSDAQRKYCEYDELYGDFRMMVVNSSYFFEPERNNYTKESRILFNDKFIEKCFEKIGCKHVWKEIAKPEYMYKVDDDAVVVTKEWLCNEYDKAFNGTDLDIRKIRELQKKYRKK